MKKLFCLSLIVFVNLACGAKLDDYQGQSPDFALFEFFEGKTKAWGMVQDYSGKQIRRFEADIVGTIEGEQLTLDEDFVYDDGETQTRQWVIEKNADGSYTGRAGDVIGEAKGREQGNALNWHYVLRVKTKDGEIDLSMDDWMYRQDQKHAFNKVKMKKFGIEVGEITLFFQKLD